MHQASAWKSQSPAEAVGKNNMTCQIINGAELADKLKLTLRKKIIDLPTKPSLAAILVGDDPASKLYVNLKKKACDLVDIDFHRYLFDGDYSNEDIIETINFLNKDSDVNGILVQLPLPERYNTDKIIGAIDPQKDVDGFHPATLKSLKANKPAIVSPLALGVDEMLKEVKELPENKTITILCNHKVFAEPFIYLYGKKNKLNVLTPADKKIKETCHEADILIVAIGKPKFIKNDFIKKDAIVIDIGINKVKDKTVGDVDFDNAMLKAKYITPVPGGVGPMTIAMLLENTYQLFLKQQSK
jgi:methylenetetrahydrofolate dehydrogenase (NADP+) / methenyltetrahydrofolate cyclohydrolase